MKRTRTLCQTGGGYTEWSEYADDGDIPFLEDGTPDKSKIPTKTNTEEYLESKNWTDEFTEYWDKFDPSLKSIPDETIKSQVEDTDRPHQKWYFGNRAQKNFGAMWLDWDMEMGDLSSNQPDVSSPNPPCTHTILYYKCTWESTEEWISPVIVDIFSTGDVSNLAPAGWMKGRKSRVNQIGTKMFEMVPGQKQLWEWVTAKAGILVHGEGEIAPTQATGANLFGNFTWGLSWKNGYEPLATLDVNGNGHLSGRELASIWVWVDANEDARIDKGEVTPSVDLITSVSVRPVLFSDNWFAPKGVVLKTGESVGSWDWWSGSFYQGTENEYVPQLNSDEPVTLFRWKQTDVNPEESLVPAGSPPKIPEGYFRFGKFDVEGEPTMMIVSISTAAPVSLKGFATHVTPYTRGGMEWRFGSLVTRAVIRNGKLVGASYPNANSDTPLYSWEAVPVTSIEDDYASSLASVPSSEFQAFFGQPFRYRPFPRSELNSGATPKQLLNFGQLLRSLAPKDYVPKAKLDVAPSE